jgi:hypothetical protein
MVDVRMIERETCRDVMSGMASPNAGSLIE